jgi:hypothetical protein
VSLVPGFAFDVFISYSHVDNQPLGGRDNGWITEFTQALRSLLMMKAGVREIGIWQDATLQADDVVDQTIPDALGKCAVFIAILSPGYLNSKYCNRELHNFHSVKTNGFEPEFGGHSRLLPIVLSNVPRETWPPLLQGITGEKFFEFDPASRADLPLPKPDRYSPELPYWKRMESVTRSVWTVLQAMKHQSQAGLASSEQPTFGASLSQEGDAKGVVYLAEVTDDLYDEREALRQFLESRRIRIEPAALSASGPDMRPAIQAALRRSNLSLHLLNGTAGKPIADGKSLSQLQVEMALNSAVGSRPIVWVPRELNIETVKNEAHKTFLNSLQTEVTGHPTPELMRIGLEDLKNELEIRLFFKPKPVWSLARSRDKGGLMVYISYFHQEPGCAQKVRDYFRQYHCAVSMLDHEGDPAVIKRRHLTNLKNCDGFVVLYVDDTLSWAEDKLQEAWLLAQKRQRPKSLGVVEADGPLSHHLDFYDDSVVTIKPRPDGLEGAEAFLSALWKESDV